MPNDDTKGTPDAIMDLAQMQLSFRTKVGHLGLLLVTVGAAIALASLLLTERGLPSSTFTALTALAILNITWAAYAGWVLSARRTMLSNHRVIAARIAVAAAACFTLGAAGLGVAGVPAGYLAMALGLVMTLLAAVLLTRAKHRQSTLERRRDELLARLQGAER